MEDQSAFIFDEEFFTGDEESMELLDETSVGLCSSCQGTGFRLYNDQIGEISYPSVIYNGESKVLSRCGCGVLDIL